MGAHNWILVDGKCPACGRDASIRCQTHVASDYAGDGRGRFFDRVYKMREQMLWWGEGDARHSKWRVDGKAFGDSDDASIDYEACHSTCPVCKAYLCAVIKFERNTPVELLRLCEEAEWPEEYYR